MPANEPTIPLHEVQLPRLRIPSRRWVVGEERKDQDEREENSRPVTIQRSIERTRNRSLQKASLEGVLGTCWDRAYLFLNRITRFILRWNSIHRIKHVKTTPQVLQTYHKSLLYGDVPLSGRLRILIRKKNVIYIWYVVELNLAILSGVLYVYSTYFQNSNSYVKNFQDSISVVFFLDYILRVSSEPAILHYVFSIRGIVELLSFIPLAFLFNGPGKGSKFIHLLQLLRIVRIFSCLGEIGIVGSTSTQKIVLLVVATIGVVFLDAGILQWLENGLSNGTSLTYWQSFYFLIVTVSTVGYGDVVPSTTAGQVLAVLTIIATVVILPSQIGKITSVASRRPYGHSFSSWRIVDSRFIIISGSVKIQVIQEFLAEFYSSAHYEDLEIYPLCVVVMAPFKPSFELEQTLSLYGENVTFMEGSPICQSDLERANAGHASVFFLLADGGAKDPKTEDAAQIVRALAVQRFCLGNVRIIVEVLEPATQGSAVWGNSDHGSIEVICPSKIHYKILSRSCYVRGLFTFISNLFTSGMQNMHIPSNHFFSEYFSNFSNAIYPVILPSVVDGLLFEEVVEFVYHAYNVVLIGLDVPVEDEDKKQIVRTVMLYPRGCLINKSHLGLVLASDIKDVYSISKLQAKDVQPCSKFRSFLKHLSSPEDMENKLELLQQVHCKWANQRRRASFLEDLDLKRTHDSSERAEPSSPHGHGKLKQHLLCVISRGLLGKSEKAVVTEDGNETGSFCVNRNESSLGRNCSSIQLEAEELLAWPPNLQYGRPHPAVLGRKTSLILQNLRDRTIMFVDLDKPHLLLCCQGSWPPTMYYLLAGLRMPGFPRPPIVILHPQRPSAFQWGSVGIFDDVFFLEGSPLYEVDLLRGGILQAEKVVVLGDHGLLVENRELGIEGVGKFSSAYTSDVDNIKIVASIEQILGRRSENLIVEMQHMTALHYLHSQTSVSKEMFSSKDYKRNPNGIVHYTPPFMEGKAVSGSMLGFLLRSMFYNKNTIAIIEQLVDGGGMKFPIKTNEDRMRVIDQVSIPEGCVNCPYSKLFLELLTRHRMLALGLYRAKGTLGSLTPYVYTNPDKETIVNQNDLVFVLK